MRETRLYNCNATVWRDRNLIGLKSYQTKVVTMYLEGWGDGFAVMDCYPTTTSKLHIRRFIMWLKQNHFFYESDILERMYKQAIALKHRYIYYNEQSDKVSTTDRTTVQTLL